MMWEVVRMVWTSCLEEQRVVQAASGVGEAPGLPPRVVGVVTLVHLLRRPRSSVHHVRDVHSHVMFSSPRRKTPSELREFRDACWADFQVPMISGEMAEGELQPEYLWITKYGRDLVKEDCGGLHSAKGRR